MAMRVSRRRGPRPERAGPSLIARGGTWRPLSEGQVAAISATALDILTTLGLADAPPVMVEAVLAQGGQIQAGRLLFARAHLEATLAVAGPVQLCGQDPAFDLEVGGDRSYLGTGGAAPHVFDLTTGRPRPSTLADLSDAARLAEALPHIHFFSRSLVARDIENPRRLDLMTALAALTGTRKHVMVQATDPAHVAPLAEMAQTVAGGAAAFRARPILSLNINHVVPPLRIHPAAAEVMAEAVRCGIPVHCNVFGQLGASSPVTMAGSVAQTLAETLAGVAFVKALSPDALAIAGPRPMITDLRTGGLAGGSGEQALATAMCVQVLRQWGLPCSVIAGATDAAPNDAQAGYEKALTVAGAVQAGAHLVTQAAGAQAGLMAVSLAGMVIDNDMLGAVLRANVPPQVTSETLALDAIREVALGTEGHFLGRPETHARMSRDFLYPTVADRRTLEDWSTAPGPDLFARATEHARHLLATAPPSHIAQQMQADLQDRLGLARQSEDHA